MKNTYKILLSCTFILLYLQLAGQDKLTLYLGGGLSFPNSEAKNQAYINKDAGLQLGGYIPLLNKSKFSLGLNIAGDYSGISNNSLGNQRPVPFPVLGQVSNTVVPGSSNNKQKALKLGIGPQLNIDIVKGFVISPIIEAGINSFTQNPISFTQIIGNGKEPLSKEIFAQDEVKSNNFFLSPKIRMSYPILKKLGVWAETNYTITEITQNRRILVPANLPREGAYSVGDIVEGSYRDESVTSKLNNLGVNFGLSYSFGKDKVKKNPVNNSTNQNLTEVRKPNQTKKPGTVNFDNPSKKEKQEIRKLVNVLPKNNTNYQDIKGMKTFSWQLLGQNLKTASYIIEIKKIGDKGQLQRTYTEKTDRTSINALSVFKDAKVAEGQYQWKVTEVSTGISSTPTFFSMSNCEINFTIANEKIECLGYEGSNRKYKISFESTYSSPSGNLTYTNPGSGLTVYDQAYTPLSYTLVSPNPILVTQLGTSSTTVNYSFEVLVASSVTAIGFGLQGDDLDPGPILCQPGVSLIMDELPDCLCDECDKMELSFNNFNISPTGGLGNQFSFNGSINVNVPIYAMEFQIQSYSYTATPSPCSNGVGSIEESGMILMPGTSINNSTSLQLFNESVSGSSSSNNNAAKAIKYSSNAALNGAIPVNLNIGLPGPVSGLDPNCCKINYRVCIKVKVFYDAGKCKSCVFTHCFEFSNQ